MSRTETGSSVPDAPKSWRQDSERLLAEIGDLEKRVDGVAVAYAGLKDLDDLYRLIGMKLDAALLLLHHSDKRDLRERTEIAGGQAKGALLLSDALQNSNISLDQKDEIVESEEMIGIRDKFQRLVLYGGAGLFDAGDVKQERARRVRFALRKALLKYSGGQHQRTGEKIFSEDHLAKYEIKEGEEDILISDRMVLPISQAVVLIEEEILPTIERGLRERPWDKDLLRRRDLLTEQVADFKATRFFPLARPLTPEKDLYTVSLSGFSPAGEALVTVDLSSIQSSGNTYDHLIEHLKVEIIRDCVDADVNRLNVAESYRTLSLQFPFLRRIESREDLKVLADLAAQRRKGDLRRLIKAMAVEDRNLLATATKRLQLP